MDEIFRTQFIIFLFSCLLGVILGFLYDVFRFLRMIINPHNIFIFFQDVIYFFVSALITFLFVLVFNEGESRFYILAGEGIGWIVYHLTFGEFVYRCSGRIVKSLKSYMNKIVFAIKNLVSNMHKTNSLKFTKK